MTHLTTKYRLNRVKKSYWGIGLLLSAFVMLAGCDQAAEEGKEGMVSIEGKVLNPQEDGVVMLFEIIDNTRQNVDSFAINNDGTFELEVEKGEPSFYVINIYNTQERLLIIGEQDLTIEADGASNEGIFKIEGSEDAKLLQEYQALQEQLSQQAQALQQKYMSAEDKAAVEAEYEAFLEDTFTKLKDFTRNAGTSLVAVLALSQIDMNEELAFVDEISAKLAEVYPDNEMVKGFRERVQAVERTAVGSEAPDIELENPEGEVVSLSSLKGKYVLIDFWASWCQPCRAENPNVVRIYNEYKDKGFEIFGVSLDRNKPDWVEAIKQDNLEWVHVSDLKFWNSEVVPRYNIEGIPMTYLLDKEGKIIAKNLRGKALEDKLREVLL